MLSILYDKPIFLKDQNPILFEFAILKLHREYFSASGNRYRNTKENLELRVSRPDYKNKQKMTFVCQTGFFMSVR